LNALLNESVVYIISMASSDVESGLIQISGLFKIENSVEKKV